MPAQVLNIPVPLLTLLTQPLALALLNLGAVNSMPQIPVAVFLTSFEPVSTERLMTELIRCLDDDPEPLAIAIRSLYDHPERAREMGREARREVRAQYSFERMVGAFDDLYATELRARHVQRAGAAEAGI